MLDWLLGLPPWAVALSVSSLVSVSVCLLGAFLTWLFARGQRTAAALELLFEKASVKALAIHKPHHEETLKDEGNWAEYERETLCPAADAIERFATLVNSPRPLAFYSYKLVARVARQRIVSIWGDRYMSYYVSESGKRSSNPITVYRNFRLLVRRLEEDRRVKWKRRARNASRILGIGRAPIRAPYSFVSSHGWRRPSVAGCQRTAHSAKVGPFLGELATRISDTLTDNFRSCSSAVRSFYDDMFGVGTHSIRPLCFAVRFSALPMRTGRSGGMFPR